MTVETGLFEVQKINPPPKSLGIHNLPVDTHNGDQITVEDEVRTPKSIRQNASYLLGLEYCLLVWCGFWAP